MGDKVTSDIFNALDEEYESNQSESEVEIVKDCFCL